MKNKLKRYISILLIISLCCTYMPAGIIADTIIDDDDISISDAVYNSVSEEDSEQEQENVEKVDTEEAVTEKSNTGKADSDKTESKEADTDKADSDKTESDEADTGKVDSDNTDSSADNTDISEDNTDTSADESDKSTESTKNKNKVNSANKNKTEATTADEPSAIDDDIADDETTDGALQIDDDSASRIETINYPEDLVALCEKGAEYYQNASIVIAPTGEDLDMTGTSFDGLGSEDYPFRGSITFSGKVSVPIILNKPLFKYISQKATVGTASSYLKLEASDNTTSAILAEHYVTDASNNEGVIYITVTTKSTSDDDSVKAYSTFGGIVGNIDEGATLKLNLKNEIVSGFSKVTGSGNRGFFCNTMGKNANLTIASYNGEKNFTVISTNSNAGALVGYMSEGASLTVSMDISYTGTVSAQSNAGGNAGGLVGYAGTSSQINLIGNYSVMNNTITSNSGSAGGIIGYGDSTTINIADEKKLTVKANINGKKASGGLAGTYIFSGTEDAIFDLKDYVINNPSFSNGEYAGSLFGMLSNTSSDKTFHIMDTNSTASNISSTQKGADKFGGLIGYYNATNLSSALVIDNISITSYYTVQKTLYGGLIGEVSSTGSSYVSIENVNVTVSGSSGSTYFGGLVALSSSGSMFNVGTVKIGGKASTGGTYGGIIGRLAGGVLRLYGTTDISGITAATTGLNYGQIVGTRTNSLIYAVGDGSDAASTSSASTSANASDTDNTDIDNNTANQSGWTLIRDGSGKSISDVGSWGEVVRIDGTKLKELQTTENITEDTEHLLIFNTEKHTVTIAGYYDYSTGSDTKRGYIYTTQNFVAMALTYQCAGSTGALIRSVTDFGMGWWIYMEGDVDLTGTGILGFQRDDGSQDSFVGLLDGQNHKITLSIGETYGLLSDGTAVGDKAGCGQIYNHRYLGLFAKTGEMYNKGKNGIKNLTVDGNIVFGNVGGSSKLGSLWCGTISANQMGGNALYDNVTASAIVTYENGSDTNSMPDVYIGGMIGYVSSAMNLYFNKCTWDGSIIDNCGAYQYYHGGFIACMTANNQGSITVTDCNIKGTITASMVSNDSQMGGLLAITQANGNGKLTITVNNLLAEGLTISNKAKNTSGGFLGYNWHNVDLDVNGFVIKDSTLTAANNACFGGLVYEASGYWKVHDAGISFTGTNTIKGRSDNSKPSAMLVCRGDDYLSTDSTRKDYALYMEIGPDAYNIADTTKVTLSSGTYFDELVGITISDAGNGIVSIAVDSEASLIDQSECNTYKNQLTKAYDNPHTRYYYNLDSYRLENGKVWADNTIESGKEMLLWSVAQYGETNLWNYFITDNKKSVLIQGDIDLTGLSYYPVNYTGSLTLKNVTLTFDYEQFETIEKAASNKIPSNKNRQHYMLHNGLLLNVTSTTSVASSISIKGKEGLTLCGTIGQMNSADYDGGSGAIICGKANGVINDSTLRTFSFSIASSSKLVLQNLKVYSTDNLKDGYAPLLINKVGSYSSINIENVSTSGYASGTKAATSLIGKVGAETDTNIVLLFENIDLDGRSASSIFKNATLLESFSYDINDMASSGTYNFTKNSTFTYGKEISNGVNGHGTTGRNPYDANEDCGQVWYYNTIGGTNLSDYVTDGETVSALGSGFFTSAYLPYVYVPEGGSDGTVEWKHELDINQLVVDITKGCGTYDDPYIIDTNGQLETLGTFLSTGNISSWSINISYDVAAGIDVDNNQTSTSLASHNDGHYLYTSGSTWRLAEDDSEETAIADDIDYSLSSAQVLAYLRNAYYVVTEDIKLGSSFYGLGGSDATTNMFSGVIIGKKADGTKPVIRISSHGSTTHNYFGGLIAYSDGSVVKDIILDYSGSSSTSKVSLTLTATEPGQKRSNQSFFGGVIGYIVGGDNIIDGVEITGLDNFSLTINGTDKKANGTYSNLTPVGAYVGLIGGDIESGGGVILRNIDAAAGFTGDDYEKNSDYYYRNPLIGRVLDGYAFAEGCTVNNTDKNYSIPTLSSEKGGIAVTSPSNNVSTITIENEQQLWILSAIVNSGAGGMDSNNLYNNEAYKLGRVRIGSYDNVGGTATGNDVADCSYWGGITYKDKNKLSYLVSAYGEAYVAYTTGGSYNYSLNFTGNCNMTSYGNGFRGIGASYQDNKSSNVLKRTIYLGGTVGGSSEDNTAVITISRKVKEYKADIGTSSGSGWWLQSIGLFPVINFNADTTVQYITIKGTENISYSDSTTSGSAAYVGEAAAGGFAGLTANGSSASTIKFKNVYLGGSSTNSLKITGAKYTGGLFGVVGQYNRIPLEDNSSALVDIGTVVGNYQFESCSYNNIYIQGGYSAGGFIGVYRNNGKTVTVSGNSTFENSDIGWINDACLNIYQSLNKSSGTISVASDNGYSGAAGLIGYYYGGTLTVKDTSAGEYPFEFSNMRIYAPRTAYNCNYGLGSIIGVMAGGGVNALGIKTDAVTVEIDMDIAYTSMKTKDSSYYTTPAAGILVGYGKGGGITLKKLLIENSRVVDSAYAGGVVGTTNNSSGDVTISSASLNNVVVYSQGAASFDGSSKAGGITGNNTKNLKLTDVNMDSVFVISDGKTGLINGFTRGDSTQKVTNFSAVSCIAATTQNEKAAYFLGKDTNPGSDSSSKGTDNGAGAAGIFIGSCQGSGNGSFDQTLGTLAAYNILIDDCIIGYYIDGKSLKYSETSGKWSFNAAVDETTIGIYTGTDKGIPYSDLTGDAAMSSTNKYTGGNLGKIIGGTKDSSALQIVGITMKGQCYPYYENGYSDSNPGTHKDASNYVIYADYTGASFTKKPNTTGTINEAYTSGYTTTIAYPYVVVNPSSDIYVYGNSTGNDKRALLTGDGTLTSSINSILSDATENTSTRPYTLTYYSISSVAELFTGEGEYVDNISSYYDASESDIPASDYVDNIADMPVLLIDSVRSADITSMVNAYISILTNCDQSGSDDKAARYTDIVVQTYKWDSSNKRFVAVASGENTLTYNSNKTLSVNGSRHDNQNNQFTLLDVRYQSKADTSKYYHLYVPVVVKKVLQVNFSVKMLTGSSTYSSIYPTQNTVLASYGENYTAQLTYSYTWTAIEWNNYISSGNSLLWNYDKQAQLDTGKNSGGTLKDDTTRLTLVDTNRYGPGDTYFIGKGTLLSSDDDSDSVLVFNDFADYSCVPISDLLTYLVTEAETGTLKVTGTGNVDDDVPAGSSIRIWNWGENTDTFTYFGPKTSNDSSGTKYYTVKVTDKNNKEYDDTDDVVVNEIYYLTVNCTEGNDVYTRELSLGEAKLTSTDSNALPTRTKSSGKKLYTLGDFYTISNTQISTASENGTSIIELTSNDYIDVSVSADIEVSEEQADVFRAYASDVITYFRFAVRLSDGTSAYPIDASSVSVDSLKIGTTELSAGEFTGELVGGVYYLTITSKKGSAFANQTVSAKIRFSYEDDAGKISEQFPERTNEDTTSGVNFLVDTSIAYNQDTMDGSSMSDSATNGIKYYREKIEVVHISYNSYNTASEDGNTSQLGINGREVSSNQGQTITSLGMYNATQISSLELTDKSSAKYPANLVCTLTLEKKTDYNDGTTGYEQVDIDTYLKDIQVESAGSSVSGQVSSDGEYEFTVPLTIEQVTNLSLDQIELDISYFVKSDEELEAIGDVGQYANYRVTLTAHLANSKGTALIEDVSDYLIYTNAKFYLGIIGTSDFDN